MSDGLCEAYKSWTGHPDRVNQDIADLVAKELERSPDHSLEAVAQNVVEMVKHLYCETCKHTQNAGNLDDTTLVIKSLKPPSMYSYSHRAKMCSVPNPPHPRQHSEMEAPQSRVASLPAMQVHYNYEPPPPRHLPQPHPHPLKEHWRQPHPQEEGQWRQSQLPPTIYPHQDPTNNHYQPHRDLGDGWKLNQPRPHSQTPQADRWEPGRGVAPPYPYLPAAGPDMPRDMHRPSPPAPWSPTTHTAPKTPAPPPVSDETPPPPLPPRPKKFPPAVQTPPTVTDPQGGTVAEEEETDFDEQDEQEEDSELIVVSTEGHGIIRPYIIFPISFPTELSWEEAS